MRRRVILLSTLTTALAAALGGVAGPVAGPAAAVTTGAHPTLKKLPNLNIINNTIKKYI